MVNAFFMKTENAALQKSRLFAIRIVHLYKYLTTEKREQLLSKQVLRSGTSIGANIEEAMGGSSRNDFKAKLQIAYKEARETKYWISLLKEGEFIESNAAFSLDKDCTELIKILSAIQNSLKKNY
jgi:four helix bundle protein